jgi:spore germination protein GerM
MAVAQEPTPPTGGRGPGSGVRRPLWMALTIAVTGVVIGIALVMTLLPRWLGSGGATTGTSTGSAVDSRKIHATLFYVGENGVELVPVSREVPLGATPGEQARRIIEAQLQAAPTGLFTAIPSGTTVRAVFLTGKGEAFVDLSHEIVSAHSGGSLDETLTVFAIVNALTVNLPDVTGVQILVDGKELDTLAGHVDLRHPLKRSLKWVRK